MDCRNDMSVSTQTCKKEVRALCKCPRVVCMSTSDSVEV